MVSSGSLKVGTGLEASQPLPASLPRARQILAGHAPDSHNFSSRKSFAAAGVSAAAQSALTGPSAASSGARTPIGPNGRTQGALPRPGYQTWVKQLRAFAEAKGCVALHQFEPLDMDEFYGSWREGVRSKAKKLERLKGFSRFCVKRKRLTEHPAEDLEPPVGAGRAAHRTPFSDAEFTRIYDTCDRLPVTAWNNQMGTGVKRSASEPFRRPWSSSGWPPSAPSTTD